MALYNEILNQEMYLLLSQEPGQEKVTMKLQYHLYRHYKNIAEKHFCLGRWHSLRVFREVIRELALEAQNESLGANSGLLPEYYHSRRLYSRFIEKMSDIARARQGKCRKLSRSVPHLL